MIDLLEKEIKQLDEISDEYISIKRKVPVKSYHGDTWRTNPTNKKYLAKDFSNRCCYCDDLDKYHNGFKYYHVEHFAPKSKFNELKNNYDNLLYCCPICNEHKSDKWVGKTAEDNVVDDKGFLDPCFHEFYDNLARRKTGEIVYLTKLGEYIYNELGLYLDVHLVNFRLDRLQDIIEKIDKKLEEENLSKKEIRILNNLKNNVLQQFFDYYMKK